MTRRNRLVCLLLSAVSIMLLIVLIPRIAGVYKYNKYASGAVSTQIRSFDMRMKEHASDWENVLSDQDIIISTPAGMNTDSIVLTVSIQGSVYYLQCEEKSNAAQSVFTRIVDGAPLQLSFGLSGAGQKEAIHYLHELIHYRNIRMAELVFLNSEQYDYHLRMAHDKWVLKGNDAILEEELISEDFYGLVWNLPRQGVVAQIWHIDNEREIVIRDTQPSSYSQTYRNIRQIFRSLTQKESLIASRVDRVFTEGP